MRIVANEFDVFVENHSWQRSRFARELKLRLVEMIFVEMRVSQSVNELTWLKTSHLRDHHAKQCVACDIERNAQENIGASLVHLQREFSARAVGSATGNIELKK